jgi:putative spermidine/putrescine transport system substrate-binding protein
MNLKIALTASVSVAALLCTTFAASAQDLNALYEAAKKEGMLTVIASPRDWCGYGGLYDAYMAKYPGITINSINEEAGSADELEAIKVNKGNTGPQAPDTIDVGLGFGPTAVKDGLVQPYKVAKWDDIPADLKDPDGGWYAGYYGVMALLVNDDLVTENAPSTWADLIKDGSQPFALTGDPRKDNRGIQGVYAAGLAATGGDLEKAAQAGLEFFKAMNDKQIFVPVNARAAALVQGQAPVIAAWDYNLLAWQDAMQGNPKTHVTVPSDAVVAGVYVQGISAYAPHPNAAKLWMEFLYSDEGQNLWLKGYCHPIRFNVMTAAGTADPALVAKLPDPALYAKAIFPSQAQQDAAKKVITEGWDTVVGANIPALQ